MKKILAVASLVVLSVLFLMALTVIAKELPMLVTIDELNEAYDGKRVTVMGWARSMETHGGSDSQFAQLTVGETVGEKDTQVIVFSADPPHPNIVFNRVIVQGAYHHGEGEFGDVSANNFIVAEAIVRDW